MVAYHFTIHAYRSWNADNERGYYQRGEAVVHAPNPALARHRDQIAADPAVGFTPPQQTLLLDVARDICVRRGWRLHGGSATLSHVHLVISWSGDPDADIAATRIKQILGNELLLAKGSVGNRWFSRGCDKSPVRDTDHLEYLLNVYIPGHVTEGGIVWVE